MLHEKKAEKLTSTGRGAHNRPTALTMTTRRTRRTTLGSEKPRRLNIVYIRSSKSVRRRFLFLACTRECVSAVLPRRYIIRCRRVTTRTSTNEKGKPRSADDARSTFSARWSAIIRRKCCSAEHQGWERGRPPLPQAYRDSRIIPALDNRVRTFVEFLVTPSSRPRSRKDNTLGRHSVVAEGNAK